MGIEKHGFQGKQWLAATAALLILAVSLGSGRRNRPPVAEPENPEHAETTAETQNMDTQDSRFCDIEIRAAEIRDTDSTFPLNDEETKMFSDLYAAMAAGRCSQAAGILNEMEAGWIRVMTETLEGSVWLYREYTDEDGEIVKTMEPFSDTTEGTGLAVTRYHTAFFGDFSEGMPNGTCLALQAMVLDEPRYTFAEGEWIDGKMNGEGKTGYCYYANAPKSGFVRTEKAGNYCDNLLDGPFVYRTESGYGETITWRMEAEQGKIVLTDRWSYSSYQKEYSLPSEEDPQRSYVLSEEKVANVMWNNLIHWLRTQE
ncbi:MAG: hypothetical protein MR528_01280 [Lachnospiraceae bacterium]|nr:hypothetical protein [Lachnospiraceae bacterium]